MAEAVIQGYASGPALLKTLSAVDDTTRKTIITQVVQLLDEAAGGKENAGTQNGAAAKPAPPKTQAPKTAPLCTVPDLTLTNPKGKFTMSVHQECMVLSNNKTEILIPKGAAQDCAILERLPGDKKGTILLLLTLDKSSNIMMGKTKLDALVIQSNESAELTVPVTGEDELSGPAAVVLCTLMGRMGVTNYVACEESVFTSSQGAAAVKANFKVQQGHLFPLASALCYVDRPALFIPHSDISWVEFLRTASSTFDIIIHMLPGSGTQQKIAIDQIDRSEVGRLQGYLSVSKIPTSKEAARTTKPAERGSGGASTATDAAGGDAGDDEDDSDDEEDEDFNPETSSSEGADDEDESSEEQEEQTKPTQKQEKKTDKPKPQQGTKRKTEEPEEEDLGDTSEDGSHKDATDYETGSGGDDSDASLTEEEPLEEIEAPAAKRRRPGRG